MTLTLVQQSLGDVGPTRALMKPSYPITLPALLVPASTELDTPVRLNKYPVLLGRSESADIRLDDFVKVLKDLLLGREVGPAAALRGFEHAHQRALIASGTARPRLRLDRG